MFKCEVDPSIDSISREDWDRICRDRGPDLGHEYLKFREHLEPGEASVLTIRESQEIVGAAHGAWTTRSSGLFSDPWKLLTNEQFLRIGEDDDGERLRDRHAALVTAVAPGTARGLVEGPELLSGAVGEAFTVRAYDASEVVVSPHLPAEKRRLACTEIVSSAQHMVQAEQTGAIVFPFVRPDDDLLRSVLRDAGFRSGTLTAASTFELGSFDTYEHYVARLPSRVRRHYGKGAQELRDERLTVDSVPLLPNVDRIAALEAQTAVKNGGQPDVDKLRSARSAMGELMPNGVRVAAARSEGGIVACAVHLDGPEGCCVLGYGCDYATDMRSVAYRYLMFEEPISRCVRNNVPAYRLGFEAFVPKRQRGARVARRETWLWVPNERQLESLGDLLAFMDERNSQYLEKFEA